MSAKNQLRVETGLTKPFVEAIITLTTLQNKSISGETHKRTGRLTRYLRLMGKGENYTGANEMAGLLLGMGIMFLQYPDAYAGPVEGLDEYKPTAGTAREYQQTLVNEALAMLEDAIAPFLSKATEAPAWALSLSASIKVARQQLGD